MAGSYTITVNTSQTPLLKNALLLAAGALAASVAAALRRRLRRKSDAERSTTSGAGGGSEAYETKKAVDEYLQFHYGREQDVMPYDFGPKASQAAPLAEACVPVRQAARPRPRGPAQQQGEGATARPPPTPLPSPVQEALQFPAQLAQLCEQHCEALRDFTGERPEPAALDVGCAVGAATFELARAFPRVYGLDYSKHFVSAAQASRRRGRGGGGGSRGSG